MNRCSVLGCEEKARERGTTVSVSVGDWATVTIEVKADCGAFLCDGHWLEAFREVAVEDEFLLGDPR